MIFRKVGDYWVVDELGLGDKLKIVPPASMTGLGIMIEFDQKTGKAIIVGSASVIGKIVAPGAPTIS